MFSLIGPNGMHNLFPLKRYPSWRKYSSKRSWLGFSRIPMLSENLHRSHIDPSSSRSLGLPPT
eukprot:Gb_23174 [translate_table: standard]